MGKTMVIFHILNLQVLIGEKIVIQIQIQIQILQFTISINKGEYKSN